MNFFHPAQVSHGIFQGFSGNVGFFHSFAVLCLFFFQDFLQKNADKNLSRFVFFFFLNSL